MVVSRALGCHQLIFTGKKEKQVRWTLVTLKIVAALIDATFHFFFTCLNYTGTLPRVSDVNTCIEVITVFLTCEHKC